MNQFKSNLAKFIASPLIKRVAITNKTFFRPKNGQNSWNKSCSEYLILYMKFHFWNPKVRHNFGTEPLNQLVLWLNNICFSNLLQSSSSDPSVQSLRWLHFWNSAIHFSPLAHLNSDKSQEVPSHWSSSLWSRQS